MREPAKMWKCVESENGAAVFEAERSRLRIGFPAAAIVRVTGTEGKSFRDAESRIVVHRGWMEFVLETSPEHYELKTTELSVRLDRMTGALSYRHADGTPLLREPRRGGRWLTPKKLMRHRFEPDVEIAFTQTIDGMRASPMQHETVFDRMAFEAKVEFEFDEEEAIFGFGSHEEGYGNLRGRSRELYQHNLKAVVPCFVSTRGYGVLFDCASLMTFHDDALGSYWWGDAVDELDYYVMAGEDFDAVLRGYYRLTGGVPMPPKWALGYVQSKERYVTATEMLDVVREYRRRRVPLDAIVLDWKSWPNGGGWGQKRLDPQRFPEPESFARELHELGTHWMVSIWPLMTGGCEDQRELLDRGLMLGNQSTYNALSPEARACYWEQAKRGLFSVGVDAWWSDVVEPFEADWKDAVKPEPHERVAINVDATKLYIDAAEINAFSIEHAKGIYEGQRRATSTKRVLNLTRSSYAGQHRYGTVTWSGDISGTWETLRRSIPEGVNFCAAGEPYWTLDIGGFFIDTKREYWFWRGESSEGCRGLTPMEALEPDPNDTGCKDLGYWELYTRWLQYATFLPMFRSHGTDAAKEIWRFGDEGTPFYDAIARFIRLRYELMPYLYSLAAEVTRNGRAMLRAVALEFPHDRATHALSDQYLLGLALLVCPVTQPMYFHSQSRPIEGAAKSRTVYLPDGADWYDFWSERRYAGGQTTVAEAPLETIPMFVRAGAILPMTEPMQFVDEKRDAPYELRVYTGCDGEFTLYEDAGDGYGYEQGQYALVRLNWKESPGELTLRAREGAFPGMVVEREYRVRLIAAEGHELHRVIYRGDDLRVRARATRR